MLMQCILVASKIVLGDIRLPILFYLLTALQDNELSAEIMNLIELEIVHFSVRRNICW